MHCPDVLKTPCVMMKYGETHLVSIQERYSFASAAGLAGAGGSCQRDRPVNQPVPLAGDKVIRFHVMSLSPHQQITMHLVCLCVLIHRDRF